MKTLVALAALGCAATLSMSALAQSGGAAPPAAPAKPDAPAAPAAPAGQGEGAGEFQMPPGPKPLSEGFTAEQTTPDAVKKAEALLAEVSKAYQAAPTMVDKIKVSENTPMGGQEMDFDIAMGKGDECRFAAGPFIITSTGGKVFMESQTNSKKYVEVPLEGSFDATIDKILPNFSLPVPHRALRTGKTGADLLKSFSLGAVEDLKVVGFRTQDGSDQILMKGSNGDAVASVNGTTKLLSKVQLVFSPMGAPPGLNIGVDLAMDPKVAEKLDPPLTVDPAGRKAVSTMEDLEAPISKGEPAPDFSLPQSDGTMVKLADLKGSVVVVDFWATWCGPCQKGLPKLDEFAKWVKESGKNVKVFGIDVWERNAPEEKLKSADEFWKKKNFSFPTLVDADDKVIGAYGFRGIPATVIIGPDGTIASVHQGFDPEMPEKLKAEVEKLLEKKG